MKKILPVLLRHVLPDRRDDLWKLYTDIGAMAYQKGRYKIAHRLFFRAKKLAQKMPAGTLSLAASQYNLALIYRHQRRFRKAMTALKQSLSLIKAELGIDCPRVVMLLDALGDTCVESGHLAKAATFYERAHTIDSKIAVRRDSDAITRLEKIEVLSGSVGSRTRRSSDVGR